MPVLYSTSFEIKMQRAAYPSPAHGSEVSLKLAVPRHSNCSLRDSLETKENSAVKLPALSKIAVPPLAPRKLDFDTCSLEPIYSPAKPVKRGRTGICAHEEKRFKGVGRVVPKMLLELFSAETGNGQFFRCYKDEEICDDRGMDLPQGQEDDCDTDEETAETMQLSLASALEDAIQNSLVEGGN